MDKKPNEAKRKKDFGEDDLDSNSGVEDKKPKKKESHIFEFDNTTSPRAEKQKHLKKGEDPAEADLSDLEELDLENQKHPNNPSKHKGKKKNTKIKKTDKKLEKRVLFYEHLKVPLIQAVALILILCLTAGAFTYAVTTNLLCIVRYKQDLEYDHITIIYCQGILHIGACFGALCFIFSADVVGRLNTLNLSLLCAIPCSLTLYYSFILFLYFKFFYGFFLGIAYLSTLSLVLEHFNKRMATVSVTLSFILALIFKGIPIWLATKFDYLNPNGNALLMLNLIKSTIPGITFALGYFVYESPKFLACSEKKEVYTRVMKVYQVSESKIEGIFNDISKFRDNIRAKFNPNLVWGGLIAVLLMGHYSLLSDLDPYIFTHYLKNTELGEFDFEKNYESLRNDTWTSIATELPPLLCLAVIGTVFQFEMWYLVVAGNVMTLLSSFIFLFKKHDDKLLFMLISKIFSSFSFIALLILLFKTTNTADIAVNLGLFWSALYSTRAVAQLLMPVFGQLSQNNVILYALLCALANILIAIFLLENKTRSK